MKFQDIALALWRPVKAAFDLTAAERRLLLGILLLFCLGLGARWLHLRSTADRFIPYTLPQEYPAP